MDEKRLKDWEGLFEKALTILDAARAVAGPFTWSFGGGTVLMIKFAHRYSKDIDIFVGDPQVLGHLNPRLSPAAEMVTDQYDESAQHAKLRLPDGEIDFIGTGWLTGNPFQAAHAGSMREVTQARDQGVWIPARPGMTIRAHLDDAG